ncbi:MAG TPA: NFACT family protein, partial [bacterium]|nr:NFACT family protein [bacterium]
MQLDSLALARLAEAARPLLLGGALRDCHAAPDGQGLVMGVATVQGPRPMWFSLSRRFSRWHLIDRLPQRQEALENHLTMVARQRLSGAIIEDLEVPAGERILTLRLLRRDFTGSEERSSLVAELMGPYSNLLVLDSAGVILATWKVVHSYENAYREVRAGKPYVPPPPTGRHPMDTMALEEWRQFFSQQPLEFKVQAALLQTFKGCTPGVVQAILADLGWEKEAVVADVTEDQIPRWAGAVARVWGAVESGERLPPWDQWIDPRLEGLALHRAFAALYTDWERAEREAERAQQWRAALKHRESELKRLRSKLFEELGEHHRALANRRLGDLIYANLHLLPQQRLGYEVTVDVPDVFAQAPPPLDLDPSELSEEELERLTAPEVSPPTVP